MTDGVRFEKGQWVIGAPPHVALKLKRVFAKINSKAHGDLKLSDTPDVARDLEWFLERHALPIGAAEREHLTAMAGKHREREQLVQRVLTRTAPALDIQMVLPPRDYQLVAAELLHASGSLICCDDLGVGKSATAITAMTVGRARPALVVAGAQLQFQWQRELEKFAPQLYTHILDVSQPYDLLDIKMSRSERARFGQERRMPDVLICTYAKLHGWAEVLGGLIKMVTFDEVQSLRAGIETKKGAAAAHIREHADFALGLTATPIYNYGGEIWEICNLIRPGALGTKEEFLEEWGGGAAAEKKGKIKSGKALGGFLRSEGIMLRRTRKDVKLEMPPITRIMHHVDADEKPMNDVKGAALRLARTVLERTDLQPVERMEAASELSWRLRQATGIAKAAHVADLVRMLLETEKKIVLFGWHREVYSIWLDRLAEFEPVLFTGSESPKKKDEAFQAFVHGKSRLLIMSLRSGEGINGLQDVCSTVVFGELDWSPAVHEQDEARVDRPGQELPVVAVYATCSSGSDPVVEDVLRDKLGQLRDIRDPDADLFENVGNDDGRIKRLAEHYLAQVS